MLNGWNIEAPAKFILSERSAQTDQRDILRRQGASSSDRYAGVQL